MTLDDLSGISGAQATSLKLATKFTADVNEKNYRNKLLKLADLKANVSRAELELIKWILQFDPAEVNIIAEKHTLQEYGKKDDLVEFRVDVSKADQRHAISAMTSAAPLQTTNKSVCDTARMSPKR